jgi:hypothetical protein
MNRNAFKKSMKKLSTCIECQEKNHCEEKKAEVRKNL